jgi:hypothetical protein
MSTNTPSGLHLAWFTLGRETTNKEGIILTGSHIYAKRKNDSI